MKKRYRSYRKKYAPQILAGLPVPCTGGVKRCGLRACTPDPIEGYAVLSFYANAEICQSVLHDYLLRESGAASFGRGAPAASGRPAKKQNKKRAAISSLRLTAGGLSLPAPRGSLPRLADRGQCSSFCRNFVLPTDGRQPFCPLPKGASSPGRMRSLQAYIAYHTGERVVKRFRGGVTAVRQLSGCP